MSSPAFAVRLIGSPPAMNFTHTATRPRASDKYATHLASGEMAGPNSCAGPSVSLMIREKDGPGSGEERRPAKPMARAPRAAPARAATPDETTRPRHVDR